MPLTVECMTESTDTQLLGVDLFTADGQATTLGDFDADVILIVNVASKCGLTPQYEQLEQLQRTYGDRGFTVVGIPCNQFNGQEPGTNEEILEYCSTTWGVSFPLLDKAEVNGENAHPLYQELTTTPDAAGEAGPVQWNFEKFLLLPGGDVRRFRPAVKPDDEQIVSLIEANLTR